MKDFNVLNPNSKSGYDGCYLCGRPANHTHELIPGTANRQNSITHGLQVRVCAICHDRIHKTPELMNVMRMIGELAFIQYHMRLSASTSNYETATFEHCVNVFRSWFGKNFL